VGASAVVFLDMAVDTHSLVPLALGIMAFNLAYTKPPHGSRNESTPNMSSHAPQAPTALSPSQSVAECATPFSLRPDADSLRKSRKNSISQRYASILRSKGGSRRSGAVTAARSPFGCQTVVQALCRQRFEPVQTPDRR